MLTACASSPARPVVSRDLPAFPAYAQPVAPPTVAAGQNPKALAGQALVALDKANGRIVAVGEWYEALRADYRAGE